VRVRTGPGGSTAPASAAAESAAAGPATPARHTGSARGNRRRNTSQGRAAARSVDTEPAPESLFRTERTALDVAARRHPAAAGPAGTGIGRRVLGCTSHSLAAALVRRAMDQRGLGTCPAPGVTGRMDCAPAVASDSRGRTTIAPHHSLDYTHSRVEGAAGRDQDQRARHTVAHCLHTAAVVAAARAKCGRGHSRGHSRPADARRGGRTEARPGHSRKEAGWAAMVRRKPPACTRGGREAGRLDRRRTEAERAAGAR
jgi:hypothetical protein